MKGKKLPKCWEGWKKDGTHIGVSGHKVNTCVPIHPVAILKSKSNNKKK